MRNDTEIKRLLHCYSKSPSAAGIRVAVLLEAWHGLHHFDEAALRKVEWSNDRFQVLRVSKFEIAGQLASFDFDGLTKLIFLAHDHCIRVDLTPSNRNFLIMFHPRAIPRSRLPSRYGGGHILRRSRPRHPRRSLPATAFRTKTRKQTALSVQRPCNSETTPRVETPCYPGASMTTATLDRPGKAKSHRETNGNGAIKRAARAEQPGEPTSPDAGGIVAGSDKDRKRLEELQTGIAKAEAAKAKLPPWDHDKIRRFDTEIEIKRKEIGVLEVKLMPAAPPAKLTFQERSIAIATIWISGNHREEDDQAETMRLARTIETYGLQARIGVRDSADGRFELIFGSRRFAAAKLAGWSEIPAKIYPHGTTLAEVEVLRSIENIGRKELTNIERAIAVARIIEAVEKTLAATEKYNPDKPVAANTLQEAIDKAGGMHAYVGQQMGFTAKWVKDNDYVSKLGGEARALLAARRIDVGHARELAKLGSKEAADHVAKMVCRNQQGLGGESIDKCRKLVFERLKSLRVVPWRLDVAFGHGAKGCTGHACVTCPHNSKSDPDLFGGSIADEPDAGFCTNETCFEKKGELAAKEIDKFVAVAKAAAKKGTAVNDDLARHRAAIFVKPASAVRKAKEIEAVPAKRGQEKDRYGYTPRKLTPEETAKNEFDAASNKWAHKIVAQMNEEALRDPESLIIAAIIGIIPPFENNYTFRDLPEKKQREAIDAVLDLPPMKIAELAIKKKVRIDFGWEIPRALTAALLSKWGVKTEPAPKLEDFLPRSPLEHEKTKEGLSGEPADKLGVEHAAAQASSIVVKLAYVGDKKGEKKPISVKPVTFAGRQWVEAGGCYHGGNGALEFHPLYSVDDFTNKFGAKYKLVALRPYPKTDAHRGQYAGTLVMAGKEKMVIGPVEEMRTLLFINTLGSEPAKKNKGRTSLKVIDDEAPAPAKKTRDDSAAAKRGAGAKQDVDEGKIVEAAVYGLDRVELEEAHSPLLHPPHGTKEAVAAKWQSKIGHPLMISSEWWACVLAHECSGHTDYDLRRLHGVAEIFPFGKTDYPGLRKALAKLAPEEMPLAGLIVTDPNGSKWILGETKKTVRAQKDVEEIVEDLNDEEDEA
jgi:ParB/RepB/Spo0J family partition protein